MEYLKFISLKALTTSMGFIALLIGEIIINAMSVLKIINDDNYALAQLFFFFGLLIVFVPSMIYREHLKNGEDERKYQAIIDHIENSLMKHIDQSEKRIIKAILQSHS